MLKHFNKSHGDGRDLVYSTFFMLTLHEASRAAESRAAEVTDKTAVLADNLGAHFRNAIFVLFKNAPLAEIELLSKFLNRIHEPEPREALRPRKDVLTIMRELAKEGYEGSDEYLCYLIQKSEAPYTLSYPGEDGKHEFMDLSKDEASAFYGLISATRKEGKPWHMATGEETPKPGADAGKPDVITRAEIAVVFRREHSIEDSCASIRRRIDAGSTIEGGRYVVTVDDEPSGYVRSFGGAGINLRDAGEAAASLVNLSESLAAAEPKEEEAISEIDNIEKKFQELKAEGTPLEWLSLFVSNSNSINLTGEEFEADLATVRKMREEELAPDPAL